MPMQVNSWAVVFPSHMKLNVKKFVSTLRLVAARIEFQLPQPSEREINGDQIEHYLAGLEYAMLNCDPRLILVVIPNKNQALYRYVKIMKVLTCRLVDD
jgi:hypothetical protein